MVTNGGFEQEFVSHGALGEVGEGWTPFVEIGGAPQFLREGFDFTFCFSTQSLNALIQKIELVLV